jgi:hypothetical protein
MRTLAVATVFGLLVIAHSAAAQDRKPQPGSPEAPPSQISTSQESETLTAERKAEDIEKARQRRMDRLGQSICPGC